MVDRQQTAVVSGVSSGIGLATAHLLLSQGYTVLGLSRRTPEALMACANFVHGAIDLSETNDLHARLNKLPWKDLPVLSVLILNAGAGDFDSVENLNYARISAQINLNLLSPILLAKYCLSKLKRQKTSSIVIIGSESALSGGVKGTAYSASKFGLRGFAQSLSAESRKSGVRVSMINPGMVDTPFFDQLDFEPAAHPDNSIDVQTVAETVGFIVGSSPHVVMDEITLSPLKKVIAFKS